MGDLDDVIGSVGEIREALEDIQEEIRDMPEKFFDKLEEKNLILNLTSLAEAQAKVWRYSFAVTNKREPDYLGYWGTLLMYLASIPFWLGALYAIVRFVKWAWTG